MIVFWANPVMRLVERIEFPSTSALMICARSSGSTCSYCKNA